MERLWEIDALRGIAVLMMIIANGLFDLTYFSSLNLGSFASFLFWFSRITAALFIFLVGVSLTLSYSHARKTLSGKELFQKYFFRGLKIFSMGLIISLITFFLFPKAMIFFGILHFIGIAIILSYPPLYRAQLALPLAIIAFALGIIIQGIVLHSLFFAWIGFSVSQGFYSFDFVPVFPWIGVAFLGIFFGNRLYPHGKRAFVFPVGKNVAAKLLCFLGRHSLLIYFLHQPLLVALIFLIIK